MGRIIVYILLMSCLVSCEKETGQWPRPVVGTSIRVPNDAEAVVTVAIEMSSAWHVDNNSSWYAVTPLHGEAGMAEIKIMLLEANPDMRERVYPFEIVDDAGTTTVYSVIQDGVKGVCVPDGEVGVMIDGGEVLIALEGNVVYELTSSPEWMEFMSIEYGDSVLLDDGVTYSKYLSSKLLLQAQANDGAVRDGEVVLSAAGKEFRVTVRQMGDMTVDVSQEFYRRSTVMRFTATWCGNCPDMAEAISDAMTEMPGRMVLLNVHTTSSKGGLAYDRSRELEYYYDISGYPSGVENGIVRIMNDPSSVNATKELFLAVTQEAVESYPARTVIGGYTEVKDGSVRAELSVGAKESGDYKVCAFLLEDGIVYEQSSGGSNYVHNYVVREEMTDDLYGEVLTLSAGEVGTVSLEIPVPSSVLDPERLHVVAFVTYEGVPEIRTVEDAEYIECGTIVDNVLDIAANSVAFFEYGN